MKGIIMACGHVANARTKYGKPACAICMCEKIGEMPDLTNRIAKCLLCGNERDSNIDLPFFEYRPDSEYDNYYCGCMGWD